MGVSRLLVLLPFVQTREEFRQMFDHTLYDKMRKKLGCDKVLPDVYDKVCVCAGFYVCVVHVSSSLSFFLS